MDRGETSHVYVLSSGESFYRSSVPDNCNLDLEPDDLEHVALDLTGRAGRDLVFEGSFEREIQRS